MDNHPITAHEFLYELQDNAPAQDALPLLLGLISRLNEPAWFDDRSLIGHVCQKVKNERAAKTLIQALVAQGAPIDDGQISKKHDKALNVCLDEKRHGLGIWLLEQGADANEIVHEWLREPRSAAQAKGLAAISQAAWDRWDDAMRIKYAYCMAINIVRAEVVAGNPLVSQEFIQVLDTHGRQQEGRYDHQWQRALSWLGDALHAVKSEPDFTNRALTLLPRWADCLDGDQPPSTDQLQTLVERAEDGDMPHAFQEAFPAMVQAARMQNATPAAKPTTRARI